MRIYLAPRRKRQILPLAAPNSLFLFVCVCAYVCVCERAGGVSALDDHTGERIPQRRLYGCERIVRTALCAVLAPAAS